MNNFKELLSKIKSNKIAIWDVMDLVYFTSTGVLGEELSSLLHIGGKPKLLSERFDGLFYNSVLHMEFYDTRFEKNRVQYCVCLKTKLSLRKNFYSTCRIAFAPDGKEMVIMENFGRIESKCKLRIRKPKTIQISNIVSIIV